MQKVSEEKPSPHRWKAKTTLCSNGKRSPVCKKPLCTREISSKKNSFIKLVLMNADKKHQDVEKKERHGLGITKYVRKISPPLNKVMSPDPGIYAELTKQHTVNPVKVIVKPVRDGDASGDAPKVDLVPKTQTDIDYEQRRNLEDSQVISAIPNHPIRSFSPRSGSLSRNSAKSLTSFLLQENKGMRKKSSILLNKISNRPHSASSSSKTEQHEAHSYIPNVLCVFFFLVGLVLNIYFMLMFIPIFAGMLLVYPRDNRDQSLRS